MRDISCNQVVVSFAFALALLVAVGPKQLANGTRVELAKLTELFPDKYTSRMLKNDLKVLLANVHLRRVPLTQKHAERSLSKLYKEEKQLFGELSVLRNNLRIVNNNSERNSLRVLQIETAVSNQKKDRNGVTRMRKPNVKLTEVTEPRINAWRQELVVKEAELEHIRARITETKNLIREPDQYISVPFNYGRIKPERQREIERELMIKDRNAIYWRKQIYSGEIEASFMTDEW